RDLNAPQADGGDRTGIRAGQRLVRPCSPRSEARELALEVVEAERAEGQRRGVPGAQVERPARRLVPRPGSRTPGEPRTFAELVADRLPRPAEVPHDLAADELGRGPAAGGEELLTGLGGPDLTGPEARGRRDLQPQVHADVDHHADRPHPLPVEVAQPG